MPRIGKSRVHFLLIIVTIVAFFVTTPKFSIHAENYRNMSADFWLSDLSYLVEIIEKVHPNPFAKIDRESFAELVDSISTAIPILDDEEIAIEFMRLVAAIGDGHSSIEPTGSPDFGRFYPFRLYRFTDGIFITAIGEQYSRYAGSEVLKIGSLSTELALHEAGTLLGADNEFGHLANAPLYLSNATVLQLLGATPSRDEIILTIRRRGRENPEHLVISAIEDEFDLGYAGWGEIWGPAYEKAKYVTAFGGRSSDDFYDQNSDLPLHLRYRSAYWFDLIPEQNAVYAQINYLVDIDRDELSFSTFTDSIWDSVSRNDVDTLILDLRYNIGGDGSLVHRFAHKLIKHEHFTQSGRLYVLVGRATFSAGIMLAQSLDEHTNVTFVGEPPGASYNAFGDATSFVLPNSGLTVNLSTIYHQLSSYVDGSLLLPISVPAQFSSDDYFSGRDPAIDSILNGNYIPLADIFERDGALAAVSEHDRRSRFVGDLPWWQPISFGELAQIGNDFAAVEKWQSALVAHKLNARRHPTDWRAWHNLGELLENMRVWDDAVRHYKTALEVAPFNNLASYQQSKMDELQNINVD